MHSSIGEQRRIGHTEQDQTKSYILLQHKTRASLVNPPSIAHRSHGFSFVTVSVLLSSQQDQRQSMRGCISFIHRSRAGILMLD